MQAREIDQNQIYDENTITYLHKMGGVVYLQAKTIGQNQIHEEKTITHLKIMGNVMYLQAKPIDLSMYLTLTYVTVSCYQRYG